MIRVHMLHGCKDMHSISARQAVNEAGKDTHYVSWWSEASQKLLEYLLSLGGQVEQDQLRGIN